MSRGSGRPCSCTTPGWTSASTPESREYERALKEAGVNYTIYMYEGANHAFHNDTSQARYDPAAARLAWSRTIDFFKQHLSDQS